MLTVRGHLTLCALRDTGVYDGALWLVESSSARGLTADSDEVLPAVSHALSGYLGNRRCSLTNQLNLASTLLRPSSTCLSAHRHSQSVTWDHRQEETLDYQCLTLQSSLNSLKAPTFKSVFVIVWGISSLYREVLFWIWLTEGSPTMPSLLLSAFVPFFVTLLIFLIFVFIPCSGGKSGNKKTDGVKVTIFFDHY